MLCLSTAMALSTINIVPIITAVTLTAIGILHNVNTVGKKLPHMQQTTMGEQKNKRK